jgi:hypothetical protein
MVTRSVGGGSMSMCHCVLPCALMTIEVVDAGAKKGVLTESGLACRSTRISDAFAAGANVFWQALLVSLLPPSAVRRSFVAALLSLTGLVSSDGSVFGQQQEGVLVG